MGTGRSRGGGSRGGRSRHCQMDQRAGHLLGVLFPYTPRAPHVSPATPGSSECPLSLTGFTQQVYRVPCLEPGAGDVEDKSCSSVSGLETQTGRRRSPARVRPGRGCPGLRPQWTLLVSLQGCGPDDVHYVLPSGHLRPPGHLHRLLGHDRSVSFVHPHGRCGAGQVPCGDVRGLRGPGEQGLNASPVCVANNLNQFRGVL